MRLTTLLLPKSDIEALDLLCGREVYPNRSVAVRDLLLKEQGKQGSFPNEVCPTCGRRFRE